MREFVTNRDGEGKKYLAPNAQYLCMYKHQIEAKYAVLHTRGLHQFLNDQPK